MTTSTATSPGYRRHFWLVLAVLGLLIWVLYPVNNHSEAEDAYMFSVNLTEKSVPGLVREHGAHYLFHVCAKGLWTVLGQPNAFLFLNLVSLLSGLGSAWFLWLILRRSFKVPAVPAGLGVALHLSLYSIWRYSHEAETYGVAWCAGLASCYLGLRPGSRCLGGFAGGLFTGFHLMLSLLSGPAMGLALWRRDGFRPAFRYCLSAIAGMALMFGLSKALAGQTGGLPPQTEAAASSGPAPAAGGGDRLVSNISVPGPSAVLREAVAFGSNVLTGNWIYYNEAMSGKLAKVFPDKNLQEEITLGRAVPGIFFYVNGLTFLVALVGLGGICLASFRKSNAAGTALGEFRVPFWKDWRMILILTWMAFYTVAQFVIGAGAPESWNPLVPAVALLFGLGCAALRMNRQLLLGGLVAAAVFVHNFTGGIAPLVSRKHDWNELESRWLIDNGTAQDVVITNNIGVLDRYLDWHSKVRIVGLGFSPTEEAAESKIREATALASQAGGKVYLMREVLNPPSYLLKLNRPDLGGLRKRWQEENLVTPVPGAGPALYQIGKRP